MDFGFSIQMIQLKLSSNLAALTSLMLSRLCKPSYLNYFFILIFLNNVRLENKYNPQPTIPIAHSNL